MERIHRQVKASTQSEDLKSWISFSLLLFCFCKRKGLCRFSSHPRSPEIRTCFHFFLLLDVIDHPKREKGAVGVQCWSWAALESSVLWGRCFLLRGLLIWFGFVMVFFFFQDCSLLLMELSWWFSAYKTSLNIKEALINLNWSQCEWKWRCVFISCWDDRMNYIRNLTPRRTGNSWKNSAARKAQ